MKKKFMIITCILTCILLVACNANSKEISTESHSAEVSKKNSEFKPYFKKNIAEMSDIKVEITNVKVIKVGEPGNEYGNKPVIAFWYIATNKTGKEINSMDAWLSFFTAVQDNDPNRINELQIAAHPDATLMPMQSDIIKKGGSVKGACAYTLDDDTTPVTLIAKRGYENYEIGRIDYKIVE